MTANSKTPGVGRKSRTAIELLRAYESRNVTYLAEDGSWPIVWERASGVHVWDVEGRKYLDLTAAFGVAATGHANLNVVRAGQRQMKTLLHAMGDVHPHALKGELARRLSQLTFERWHKGTRGKTIFCNSGFEAVEAALKTALLATGKASIIAFEGAYHGLGYGALNATHREHFRSPFRRQLREFAEFAPFPTDAPSWERADQALRRILGRGKTGAILVEPIQVRGGVNIPPPEFLPLLRRLCDEHQVLLILDEIYTGLGRTGAWFACEQAGGRSSPAGTVPDLICLGKALTGGFPLSACVGRAELMDAAWPVSDGEAIHTSTFLGHPVGCAMALAQITEIQKRKLARQSAELGEFLLQRLRDLPQIGFPGLHLHIRGLGLLAGVELRLGNGQPATQAALETVKDLLRRGFIVLPEGAHSEVISFSPALVISRTNLAVAVFALGQALRKIAYRLP